MTSPPYQPFPIPVPSGPNQVQWRSADDTAIVVFESRTDSCTGAEPVICRHYRSSSSGYHCDHGYPIGRDLGANCALVLKIAPHDIISISEYQLSRRTENFYRVGPDLHLFPLGDRSLSRKEIETMLQTAPPDDHGELTASERDIEALFRIRRPAWLQKILDSQLDHWYRHHVANYFRHTPRPLSAHDISRCVRGTPFWALARFKDRLNADQLSTCCRTSKKGAACFAPERLTKAARNLRLLQHATELIRFAAVGLNDAELAFCATRHPKTAIECCHLTNPRQGAVLLANGYRNLDRSRPYTPPPRLNQWIRVSFSRFSKEWIKAHDGCFDNLIRSLTRQSKTSPPVIKIDEIEILLDPSYRTRFREHIASKI